MDRQQRSANGVAYDIAGTMGGPDVVLLHGWGCDHGSLRAQIAFFAEESRVIAPDLPGFGMSAAIAAPTVQHLARSVLDMLSELGSEGAFVIGHSMGGLVGLEMSRQASAVVGCLAMLDTVLWPGPELKQSIADLRGMLQAGRFDEACAAAKQALFLPYDDSAAIRLFEQSFAAADRDSLVASFTAHLIDYDPEPAIATLKCPVAYVATDSALSSLETVASRIKGIRTGKTMGSGHFAPLLVPQQINAMLQTFMKSNSAPLRPN